MFYVAMSQNIKIIFQYILLQSRRVEATTVVYAEVCDHTSANIQTLKPPEDDRVQYSEIQRKTEPVCDQQQHHGLTFEPGKFMCFGFSQFHSENTLECVAILYKVKGC